MIYSKQPMFFSLIQDKFANLVTFYKYSLEWVSIPGKCSAL